jgi:hypothetical protein
MKNISTQKNQFQAFPYHLVDPSPWPILVGFSVFSMAIGAVMYIHGFSNGGYLLNLGFIITVYGMILWFRDVISEGTLKSVIIFLVPVLLIAKAIPQIFINKLYKMYSEEYSNIKYKML